MLTDLGTNFGTYINGGLINNTTVSLACGNIICFGPFGVDAALFEVHITDTEVQSWRCLMFAEHSTIK